MRRSIGLFLVLLAATWPTGAAPETLLLRTPTVGAQRLVFAHAGDLWSVGREGGEATRLTTGRELESDPFLSPDGRWLAFSGREAGNADVYVMPAGGGIPRRLTWHPGDDLVRGWTPDGKNILFASSRSASSERFDQLFVVPFEGGFPVPLPLPMAERAAYAPDGRHLAYTPLADAFRTWKRYRGGQTTPIEIVDLETLAIEEVPHVNASDTCPVYLDGALYFLSDRDGTMNVYAFDAAAHSVRALTTHTDFDVRSLAAGAGVLVYEQGGRLIELDPKTGASHPIAIHISADLPATHAHTEKAAPFIQGARISPGGVRVLFEARGEILSVPAEKGSVRNVTRTPGAAERSPAWSPGGRRVAYFSDEGGEYRLVIRDQAGLDTPRRIALAPGFYYDPAWSPDGHRILFTSKRLELWYVDLRGGSPVLVDTDTYDQPERGFDADWSPDGRFLAYAKRLPNHLRAVFVYDVAARRARQVTDGTRDTISPRFSPDGLYLYFAASANYALNTGWLDMSSFERPVRRTLHLALLAAGEPSPLAPESDDEPVVGPEEQHQTIDTKPPKHHRTPKPKKEEREKKGERAHEESEEPARDLPAVRIDFDGLSARILALPVPEGDYRDLRPAKDGALFFLENGDDEAGGALHRFDLASREDVRFLEGVAGYDVSRDGARLLFRGPEDDFAIVATDKPPEEEPTPLDLDAMEVFVEPRAEWRQIFDESARILRDFFYDPGMHGLDWPATVAKYRAFLPYVGHRSDLTFLLSELGGELGTGHLFVEENDAAATERRPVGLLGADFTIDHGLYRFARIFRSPASDADPPAPLAGPGLAVHEGDYLLAINGQPLSAQDNVYRLLDGTATQQTFLLVNSKPAREGAVVVTVVPTADETGLRHRAWVLENRARVDRLSGGRLAYVYLPDTGTGGYEAFNRDYFSQLDKSGLVLDDRFNSGGAVADYIIDLLGRTPLSWWVTREGAMFSSPVGGIFGPRAMIINEYSASGGDALAQFFRRRGLGPLVGRRTWGGLVGVYDYPTLMDGGTITAPRVAIVSPEGRWEVENEGVRPDVDVPLEPAAVAQGHDPQLERAVAIVLEELAKHPPARPGRPEFPGRARHP